MNSEKINWKGASGKLYTFYIYAIDFDFKADQAGNYIFSKVQNNNWEAIYIGEGDLKTRTNDETHRTCATKKGATHIHVHFNSDEVKRKEEETDLLEYNTEAYHPKGCNKKAGG